MDIYDIIEEYKKKFEECETKICLERLRKEITQLRYELDCLLDDIEHVIYRWERNRVLFGKIKRNKNANKSHK